MFGLKEQIRDLENTIDGLRERHLNIFENSFKDFIQIIHLPLTPGGTQTIITREPSLLSRNAKQSEYDEWEYEEDILTRTFNTKGEIIKEITVTKSMGIDGVGEREYTSPIGEVEYIHHDNKTEKIEYLNYLERGDNKYIQERTLTFFGSDGRIEREEIYNGNNPNHARPENVLMDKYIFHYDKQGRLDHIKKPVKSVAGEGYYKHCRYEYESDDDLNPSKEISGSGVWEEEKIFSYDLQGRKVSCLTKVPHHSERIYNSRNLIPKSRKDFVPKSRIDYGYYNNDQVPYIELEIENRDMGLETLQTAITVTSRHQARDNEYKPQFFDRAQDFFNSLSAEKKNKLVSNNSENAIDGMLETNIPLMEQIKAQFNAATIAEKMEVTSWAADQLGLEFKNSSGDE